MKKKDIMKKGNYFLVGIVIIVAILAIALIFIFSQKNIPDYYPVIDKNNSGNVNNSDIIVNNPPAINISGNYKVTLKTKNPQYKQGSEVFFIYEIENIENQTLNIPKNTASGIEIKDSVGTPAKTYPSSDKLVILKEDLSILPLEKTKNEFSIIGDDFELTGLNPVGGSYYAVTISIGNVKSNKAMIRILK